MRVTSIHFRRLPAFSGRLFRTAAEKDTSMLSNKNRQQETHMRKPTPDIPIENTGKRTQSIVPATDYSTPLFRGFSSPPPLPDGARFAITLGSPHVIAHFAVFPLFYLVRLNHSPQFGTFRLRCARIQLALPKEVTGLPENQPAPRLRAVWAYPSILELFRCYLIVELV